MERFELSILGCGSALPTTRHAATSQVIDLRNKSYMIDCGEGTQVQMRKLHVRFNRLNHIFISHLHGDHCFGLPGLLATLGMLGRTGELTVHGPKALQDYLNPVFSVFFREMPFPVRFNEVNPDASELVWEDRAVRVYSIPLKHRLPTAGYLFEEKQREPHILREMTDFYRIPVKELPRIKRGEDFITPEGETIPYTRLTRPAEPAKRYAYCSDTAYTEKIVPLIEGVDLLYHEATFGEADAARAAETFHSTARQAAEIARKAGVKKLLIGHYSARYEDVSFLKAEADAVFPGTRLAAEGLKLTV